MKTVLLLLLFLPSVIYGTTVTASVGGTLRVYENLSVNVVYPVRFPAQFAGTLPANLTNVHGGAPATGIPSGWWDTLGNAGVVQVTGTGGSIYTPSIASTMTLTNAASTLTANLSLYRELTYVTLITSTVVIPGSGPGAISEFYVKGVIPSGTVIAGTYSGSAVLTISY